MKMSKEQAVELAKKLHEHNKKYNMALKPLEKPKNVKKREIK